MSSVGPRVLADKLASLVPAEQRASYRILDVGAGTGRVGEQASKLGFKNMEALGIQQMCQNWSSLLNPEPCEAMLDIAKEKGFYVKHHCRYFGNEEENKLKDVDDETFDCLVIAGSFVIGHLGVDSVIEAARLIKKGKRSPFLNDDILPFRRIFRQHDDQGEVRVRGLLPLLAGQGNGQVGGEKRLEEDGEERIPLQR